MTTTPDLPLKFTPPPIQNVLPPSDVAERPSHVLIYGYPITNQLVNLRYSIIKATHPNMTRTKYFPHLTRFLKGEIRKLLPEGKARIHVVLAETSGHEGGSIPLLAVGVAGRKPPPDVLRQITEQLESYGVVEAPGWYPRMSLILSVTVLIHRPLSLQIYGDMN